MSSAIDIEVVSMPNVAKIENFLNDVTYREAVEFSANFNTRLCIERRLRLPFLDPQTGVAQSHSHLFMEQKERMPGFRQGQIFTYPATRWRKSRRQYLGKLYRFPDRPFQAFRKEHETVNTGISSNCLATATVHNFNTAFLTGGTAQIFPVGHLNATSLEINGTFQLEESTSLGAAGGDTSDSKDSQLLTQQQQQQQQQQHQQQKDELPKDWFYDDIEMNDVDSLEDPKSPADDEYDYDPRYGSKKRRKRRAGKQRMTASITGSGEVTSVGGNACMLGGRRRAPAARNRATTDAMLDASLDAASGRRPRGSGSRGRRRAKAGSQMNACDPLSPGLVNEPPSFESAAAAVGVGVGVGIGISVGVGVGVVEDVTQLRNYRKYL